MTHWKLILAYDGTPFHGWQIQPGLPTVQGLLSDAIHRTVGERVLPQGSGRTDTGVHALGQVVSFSIEAPIPASNLHSALNRCLPPSVRILSVEAVPPEFHARHRATHKTYEYRIFPIKCSTDTLNNPDTRRRDSEMRVDDPICPPILAPYVWPCPWPLSLDLLNRAAVHVVGTHDFTSFAASDPDLTTRTASEATASSRPGIPGLRPWASYSEKEEALAPGVCTVSEPPLHSTNIRTITHSAWHAEDSLLIYRVTATGFLHHMVRNLVGTFVQCGAHRLDPDSIPTLLAARNRSAAGPTAPPTGLFLVSVGYPEPRTAYREPNE